MQRERSIRDEMGWDWCLPEVPSHTTHTESEAVTDTDTALPSLRVPLNPSPGGGERLVMDDEWLMGGGRGRS
jgi:hypothetical protein